MRPEKIEILVGMLDSLAKGSQQVEDAIGSLDDLAKGSEHAEQNENRSDREKWRRAMDNMKLVSRFPKDLDAMFRSMPASDGLECFIILSLWVAEHDEKLEKAEERIVLYSKAINKLIRETEKLRDEFQTLANQQHGETSRIDSLIVQVRDLDQWLTIERGKT